MFNTLFSLARRDAKWSLDDAVVFDLFAGTGALGLEALSRGAGSVIFFESDRSARALIEQNLSQLDVDANAFEVVPGDVMRSLESIAGPSADVVFADPPYDFDRWAELIGALPAQRLVAESSGELVTPEGWRCIATRSYGTTVLTFFERTGIQGKEDR